MGIVNVTPDSFFDGGKFDKPDAAMCHARDLVEDGADILDVGGESSRPGADTISIETELNRVLPVVGALQDLEVPVSIDTYHSETARRSLELGATMVNDITALRGDAAMGEVIAEAGCQCVLMHMQGTPQNMQEAPQYDDVVDDICAFFEERMKAAVQYGIREEAIWLDPGFGFGKTIDHNLRILRRLDEFKRLGRPLLIGTSNKSTIGKILDCEIANRREGTAVSVAVSILKGADCVRVHDVRTMAQVVKMCDAIMGKQKDG